MTDRDAMDRFCGARRKQEDGKPCELPAGWGTEHKGYGACRYHAGTTPNAQIAAARQEARSFMAAADPAREVDPAEALLFMVSRAAQIREYCQLRVSQLGEGQQVTDGQVSMWARLEMEAGDRLVRYAKTAIDANVAVKRVQRAQREGQVLSAAFEDAMREVLRVAGVELTRDAQLAGVRVYLARLAAAQTESDTEVIEA